MKNLVMSHSENFVGHTSVQEVFDNIWSGETIRKVISFISNILSFRYKQKIKNSFLRYKN